MRLARYLAGSSLPPSRPLEPAIEAGTPKQGRSIRKGAPKGQAEPARTKTGDAELEGKPAGRAGGSAEDAIVRGASEWKGTTFVWALSIEVKKL